MCTNLSKNIDVGDPLRDLKCVMEANTEMLHTSISSGTSLKWT